MTSADRVELLRAMPPRATVAEVGVFRGGYAVKIADVTKPEMLHLIDPWSPDPNDRYSRLYGNVSAEMPALYAQVCARFALRVETGRAAIHRGYAADVLPTFPDASLHWAYLDAVHAHEDVLADLRALAPKIYWTGFILGHDFSNTPSGRAKGFGVISAVRQFTEETDWRLVIVTIEAAPTFVLARDRTAAFDLQARVLRLRPGLKVPPAAVFNLDQRQVGLHHNVIYLGETA